MRTERLVRQALEDSVKNLPCPEPDLEQLVAAGRAMRNRRVGMVAGLAAAAVLVLVVAGLSFAWAGRTGRALEPVPANPSTSASIGSGIASPMQQWVDALPAGAPPATPYWHDGTLYVNGEQIPAPYGRVDIKVAGDTVLVGGYEGEDQGRWALGVGPCSRRPARTASGAGGHLRGGAERRRPNRVLGDSRAWHHAVLHLGHRDQHRPGFAHGDGRQVELRGIDAAGNGYWQPDGRSRPLLHPMGRPRRHGYSDRPDLRALGPARVFRRFRPVDALRGPVPFP